MLKLYFFSLLAIAFTSCGVSVSYLGNSFDKTSRVDVYVDPSAIKKSYTLIGKGYLQPFGYPVGDIERLQEKVIEKAKQKGADAVLFQDYYVVQPGTAINTTTRTDTVQNGVVSSSQTFAGPVVQSNRQILFLKYN